MTVFPALFRSNRRGLFAGVVAGLVISVSSVSAHAEWPERPISLIVPWGAGGGTDAIARTIAAGLEKELGKPVNVVNRTGGGGVIGHSEIVNAKPDGYTIGLATAEITTYWWAGTAPFTYEKLTPIALVNFDAAAFHVAADSPWKDANAALDAIRKAPAGNYKLSGMPVGAAYHLAFATLLKAADIDPKAVRVVPSQGAAPGFQELAAGGVQIVPSSLPEGAPMVDAKKARALLVLSKARIAAFPDVPTVKEATGKDVPGGTWRGIVGPAGLPDEVTKRLTAAVEKVVKDKGFVDFMNGRGFGLDWAKGDDFKSFLAEQHKRNGEVMALLGLKQRKD